MCINFFGDEIMGKNILGKNIIAAIYMVIGLALLMGTADAVNKTNADWYLHLDIKAIEHGSLKDLIEHKTQDNDVDKILVMAIGEHLKEELEKITVYGTHTGLNDFTLMMQGDFSDKARKDFQQKMADGKNHGTEIVAGNTLHSWVFDGYHSADGELNIEVDDDDKPLQLYAAELGGKAIVVSRDKNEVKSWMEGQYSINELDRDGVFEVVVNLQNALAHGGFKFGKGKVDLGFDSSVMQKVSQFSFSVAQNKKTTDIEVGLVTKDKQIALQLKNIVNGLIALQAIAGDMDEDIQAFTKNLSIEAQGVNVILKSSIETSEIKKLTE